MIKTVIKASALWLFMCALIYGLGVFISWEPNAANWDAAGRSIVAWLWLVCAPLAAGFVISLENND